MTSEPVLDAWDIERYSRHLLLEPVGIAGQLKLKASAVLVVGAGGLGSPVLAYLAAAGVGRIGIVDFDRVDASNLQRQIIHGSSDVGRPKVESARDHILSINSRCQVDVFDHALTRDNALAVMAPYDLVVDGTDNFPTRYLANDAAVILGKPYVYGSIFKFEGQVSVFNHDGGPNYRDLYPEPPHPDQVPSCSEGGVLGVLPGVIGCIQATEALKILLGKGTTLSGRLLLYDALEMRFRELTVRPDPGTSPITELIDYPEFCGHPPGNSGESFERMTATEVAAKLDSGWTPFVLDVRKEPEAAIVRLAFADARITHTALDGRTGELPTDRDSLVPCKHGRRTASAAANLKAAGFDRVVSMEGGIHAWALDVDQDLPTS